MWFVAAQAKKRILIQTVCSHLVQFWLTQNRIFFVYLFTWAMSNEQCNLLTVDCRLTILNLMQAKISIIYKRKRRFAFPNDLSGAVNRILSIKSIKSHQSVANPNSIKILLFAHHFIHREYLVQKI